MKAEICPETLRDPQTDSDFFLEQLALASNDPRESLIVMQAGLNIDVGQRVGFYPGTTRNNPELIRGTQLSALQYEKIKSLEELVGIYIEAGSYSPRQLGRWFNDIQLSMDNTRLIDVLFDGFSEEAGFHRGSLQEVSRCASAFLPARGFDAVWARWGD